MEFKSQFRKLNLHLYIDILLGIASIVLLLNAFIYRKFFLWLFAPLTLLCVCLTAFALSKRKAFEKNLAENLVIESEIGEKYFDRYGRRLINWILIAFYVIFTFAFSLINLGFNSKMFEVVEKININLISFEIVGFFLVKNLYLLEWLHSSHPFERKSLLTKEIARVCLISFVYWGIAEGIFYYCEEVFVLNAAPFFSGIYIAFIVIFNVFRINNFAYAKRKHSKIVIATVAIIAIVFGGYSYLSRDIWLTQPYINRVPNIYDGNSEITYDDDTGIYTITKPEGDFKILQLTDIHLGGSVVSYDKDVMALDTIFQLLDETRPDFVIVTGDLAFPIGYASFSFNNTAPVQQFAAFMRNTGIPWAFTYGNHDTESYAASSKYDLNELYKSLSWKTTKNLLYPYIQPDIMGRNNQVIALRNEDGSMNQALFLIDSNAYLSGGYDYIHDDQVEWYKQQVLRINKEEGRNVPSLIFIHIPLQEYRTAYQLYEDGSDEVTYFFGENKENVENTVSCSDYPSKLFDTAVELGSTKGIFCGHDHYNNMSLEYKGIRLTYDMSIDYLAMSGIARDKAQRGAILITIHDDGTSDIEQVPFGNRKIKLFGAFND